MQARESWRFGSTDERATLKRRADATSVLFVSLFYFSNLNVSHSCICLLNS